MGRMELKDRISEALHHARKSPTQVAKETGLSDSALSQLLTGKTKTLKAETAVSLCTATGVRTEWLVTGQGQMALASVYPTAEEGISVLLLANAASMGTGEEVAPYDVVRGSLTLAPKFVTDNLHPTNTEALRFIHAHGDSMEPTFYSGDILLVDTGIQDVKIDGVYVLKAHDRLFVKRVRQRLDGKYEVSSDNPTHKTVDVLNGEHTVEIIGRVLWVWNGHKM